VYLLEAHSIPTELHDIKVALVVTAVCAVIGLFKKGT
jgi:hypothetical protein